ncbi:hypothetical protein J4402_03980 [Candidatus Pacearchaeota archaeon]|nr:hypothetical protein [Candidatus Pacearchaeota archaeon]
MGKKLIIIFFIILILVAIFSVVFYSLITPGPLLEKPFLYINWQKGDSFQRITLDGENVLFTKREGITDKYNDRSCQVYLKNINSEKEMLLTKLDYCYIVSTTGLHLSKDKKFLFFETEESSFETYVNNKTGILARPEKNIYGYDLDNQEFFIVSKNISNLLGISSTEDKILFDRVRYTYGEDIYKNQTQHVEIFIYDLETREEKKVFEEAFNTKIPVNNSSGWDDGWGYNYGFTRWSPEGDAVIYELVLGGLPQKQYIFYLDSLEVKELIPENVRGNINVCGYWYSKGEVDPTFIEGYSGVVFRKHLFSDGKTYLKRFDNQRVMDSPLVWSKYYLKELEESYCNPK